MSVKKISVLYVVENTSYGGGERGFGQLFSAINRDHFLPYIAAHPGGILEDQAREKGVKFFQIDMHRKFNLKTISKISDIITEHKINIAHSMGSRADFFVRMACRKMHDVQIISTIAMLIEGYDVNLFRKAIYRLADRYSSKFVSHFIAVSKALKTRLILERKIPIEKISVIYNGVELDKYNPGPNDSNGLRHSFGIETDCAVVGTIGRLVYQKGFEYFIEAAKLISKKNFNIRFVVVGHGPEEKNLKKKVERAGISQIFIFAGQRFDIPQLLGIFDIFVLPSVLEGLPRVVIEAMAMGKPIVATDIEGVREELIHDRTGLIVPVKNPKALSEAVNSLLDNEIGAIQMGNEARKSAEKRFDLNKTVFNIERLYERLLS